MTAVSPHTMYATLLGARGAEALPVPDRSYLATAQILDEIGVDMIASQLSTGRLPAEVSLLYEVPILHMRRWMQERMDETLIDEIKRAAAESLQVKSILTLSAHLKNPAEASQAKALSERFAKIAEALSPKDWNPARVEAPGQTPAVSISINMPETAGVTIDHQPNGAETQHLSHDPLADTQGYGINYEVSDAGTSSLAFEGGDTPSLPPSPTEQLLNDRDPYLALNLDRRAALDDIPDAAEEF